MATSENEDPQTTRWRRNLLQRRVSATVDHIRPQRWNWYPLVQPLDSSLARRVQEPITSSSLRNLRYFWLDGLFAAISENFYLGFIALFALAYGATNRQVGFLAASANLLGALALFPGAALVEKVGRRKPVILWSAGGLGRFSLLGLALIPILISDPMWAIVGIIVMDGLRSFMSNLANPGWTDLVSELVPQSMRGRFLSSRNTAMGLAALMIAPLAGRIISSINVNLESLFAGYQAVFVLAFFFGMVSTALFSRIREAEPARHAVRIHHRGDLRRMLRQSPQFVGLVVSAFVWNMALQVAAPFFTVYLATSLQATTLTIGILSGVASMSALVGQRVFGRVLDSKGAYWLQIATGIFIPLAPLAWAFVNASWQVGFINLFSGFLWAGYNLANFNLLLQLTPDEQRPRAVALYQTVVFGSAVAGPLLGGYLADTHGYQLVFLLSSGGRFLGMILFLWLVARHKRSKQHVNS